MQVINILSGYAAVRYRLPFLSKIGKIHSGNRLEKFTEMSAVDKPQIVSNLFHSHLGKTAKTFCLKYYPLPNMMAGGMSGYAGPEQTRSEFRRKRQTPESKRLTRDVLAALRTGGTF